MKVRTFARFLPALLPCWLALTVRAENAATAQPTLLVQAAPAAGGSAEPGEGNLVIQKELKAWMQANPTEIPPAAIPDTWTTLEDFEKAVESALKREGAPDQAAQLVRLHLEMLVRFFPGALFDHHLASAAVYADFLDRTDNQAAPPKLLDVLLKLCAKTPALSEPHVEGLYVEAQVLSRAGRLDDAARLLKSLAENDQLDRSFRVTAYIRYANNCLARKDFAAALTSWNHLTGYLEFDAVPDELYKAMLLALEMGRRDEALTYLEALGKSPRDAVVNADAAKPLEAFLQHATEPATAVAWWEASAKWWPLWQAFESAHGIPLPAGQPVLPIIPDVARHRASMLAQARAGQKAGAFEHLRLVAHAARWQPFFAAELVSLLPVVHEMTSGTATADFRKLVIAIHGAGAFEKAGDARRIIQLWGAAASVDEGQADSAQQILKQFHQADTGTPDGISCGMARLWAILAMRTGQDLPEVAKRLEQVLAAAPPEDARHLTVTSLASVYQRQNRMAEERTLIETELQNPAVQKSAGTVASLRQRLDLLKDGGAGSTEGPAKVAEAWLRVRKPSWYDYARPRSLQELASSDLDRTLENADDSLLPAEIARLCLLIAQDAAQPMARRLSAVARLAWFSGELAQSPAEATSWANAIVEEKTLPKAVRVQALDFFLRYALAHDETAMLARFATHPLLEGIAPATSTRVTIFRKYAALPPADFEAMEALADSLLAEPLDQVQAEAFRRLFSRIAYAGRFESAERLLQKLAATQNTSLQLALQKGLERARQITPLQDALRTLYLKHRPSPSGPAPVKVAPRDGTTLNLSDEDATAVREAWLRDGTWPRGSFYFWLDLLGTLPQEKASHDLGLAMLALALEKSPTEADRAAFIMTSLQYLDADDPDTRSRLLEALKPYATSPAQPLVEDAVRAVKLYIRLRTEELQDCAGLLDELKDERQKERLIPRLLSACVAHKDLLGLERLLKLTPPASLRDPQTALLAWQASTLLGRTEDAARIATQLREHIYRSVLQGWVQPEKIEALVGVHLAARLKEPALIPDRFVPEVVAQAKSPRQRLILLCLQSLLEEKWEDGARYAAQGRRLYPTNYDFHGHEGVSLGHLGRKEEAMKALQTYLEYTHNNADALPAREMLDSLTK